MSLKYCLLILLFPLFLSAQTAFESKKLELIYSLLPKECNKNEVNRNLPFTIKINNRIVNIGLFYNGTNNVSHIGIKLFDSIENLIFPNPIFTFLERTLLEYLLIPDKKAVLKEILEDKLKIYFNDNEFGTFLFSDFSQILNILNNPFDFKIAKDSLRYTTVFGNKNGEKLQISFPAINTLITGMDKSELDQQLTENLLHYKASDLFSDSIQINSLEKYKGKIYVLRAKTYFQGITSDTYYINNENKFSIVFDMNYCAESFANAFLKKSSILKNKKLIITHRLYGNKTQQFTLNLNDFVDYFSRDYELFFGIEDSSVTNLTATLIMNNTYLNFNNLLAIKTSYEELFNPEKAITATLYSNVPTDNIKSLFGYTVDENNNYKYYLKK